MAQAEPALFELRSGRFDALQFILKTNDLTALHGELERRVEAMPEFFDGEPVTLDLRRLPVGPAPALDALGDLLRSFRMTPLAVFARDDQAALIQAAGLPRLAAPAETPRRGAADAAPPAAPAQAASAAVTPAAAGPVASAETGHEAQPPTLTIDKPLRSGQRVVTRGDLIVTAAVSHGAELIAAGNIHVYAPLRGRALAGALGREDARIFTTCMEAELLAIAGYYRTAEEPFTAQIQRQPASARLVAGRLVIEPLALR